MGETRAGDVDQQQMRSFMRRILDDVEALEQMLERGMIETGVRRIGAEQEMFLVDRTGSPAPIVMDIIDKLDPRYFTTELARFNLECNMDPLPLAGRCLSIMEHQVSDLVDQARKAAASHDADVFLTGILPTVKLADLSIDAITPLPRYKSLNDTIARLRGGKFQTLIKGIDELQATHDNILLEACNTSFQVHFQTGPAEFATLYNLAQAVTGPVLAAAVNSPVLLQHRLWRETRIALFQQSIDTRSSAHQARGHRARVHFGDRWVDDSVLEIFREDIARFRVMLAVENDEDSLAMVAANVPPPLSALRLHNGTIYRWNRPCYGIHEGVAHLRIENRVLPAGPTILDEIANAAFFFGLMSSVSGEYGPIEKAMDFDTVKANFTSAARHGLMAQFTWADGREYKASELILDHLLPLAREGLKAKGIDSTDIDRYLGVLEERVRTGQTGARWMLASLQNMNDDGTREERYRSLVSTSLQHQKDGEPVHTWKVATLADKDWRHSYRTVDQFMTRDIFTVRPGDIVDLAASVMSWEHIRHVPVEDDAGRLVGLVSHRELLRLIARGQTGPHDPVAIEDIMKRDVITVRPETKALDAIRAMRDSRVGCLPVVDGEGQLVGIVTEGDLLRVAADLMEQQLAEAHEDQP